MMAILFDNKYRKITRSVNDFVNDRTDVFMSVYDGTKTREKEKVISEPIKLFRAAVTGYINNKYLEVERMITAVCPLEEITDRDGFLNEHLDIRTAIEEFERQRDEGLKLMDKITVFDIDKNTLQYLPIWQSLGLTDEMLTKIGYLGEEWQSLDGQVEPNLSILYGEIKKHIASEVEDV